MKKLQLFESQEQEILLLENYIKKKAVNGSVLNILEAGCGQRWPLNLSSIKYTLTGIDLDQTALDIRKTKFNDIDEAVVGDLLTIDLPENKFDIIYNSFVFEHVKNAQHLLDNFFRWLKPGGYLILRFPDRDSVFGFITRITPFWFHVAYRRYVDGNINAGKPGFSPYPTFYEPVVSRKGIHKYCQNNSRFIIREEYGSGFYLKRQGAIRTLIRLFVLSVGILSFGRLGSKHNNLTFILEKKIS